MASSTTTTSMAVKSSSQTPASASASTRQSGATMVDMSSPLNRPPGQSISTTSIDVPTKKQQQQQQPSLFRNSGNSATTAGSRSNSLTVEDNGSNSEQEEEGVLRDVLQELDKERTRRAELEAQIRQIQAEKLTLEQELQVMVQSNAANTINNSTRPAVKGGEELEISRRAFFAMEAQVQGYQQIVDALTLGKPAIAHAAAEEKAAMELSCLSLLKNPSPRRKNQVRQQAASKAAAAAAASLSSSTSSTSTLSSSFSKSTTINNITFTPTLPLHVVRLLEVMPWDARAQIHVFGKEEMYEWQVWNERDQSWTSSSLKLFPRLFQTLPIATGTKAAAATANNNAGDYYDTPTTGASSLSSSSIATNHHNNSGSIGRRGGAEQQQRNNLLAFLAGAGEKPVHLPTKHGVLTNEGMNYILNIEAGYPLPQDGGVWEWVGGWRIEKRVTAAVLESDDNSDTKRQTPKSGADGIMPVVSSHISNDSGSSNQSNSNGNSSSIKVRNKVDCDESGWSYVTDVSHFQTHPTELVWDNPGGNCGHQATDSSSTAKNVSTTDSIVVERKIRRRKWSRKRVLVDYPHASEGTKQYLKLLAENARLTMTANKVSDQLVETKLSLTETEEKLESTRTEMTQQMAILQQEIREKTQLLAEAGVAVASKTALLSSSSAHSHNALQELFNKSEHGKQQLGSKISQWIHGSSGRKNSDEGSTASNDSAEENPLQSGSAHSTGTANAATASAEVAAAQATTVLSSVSSTGSGGSSSGGFDWRKVGPGTLLDKFKPGAASSNKNDNSSIKNDNATTTTMPSSARRHFFQKGGISSNLDDEDLTVKASDSSEKNDNQKAVTETTVLMDGES